MSRPPSASRVDADLDLGIVLGRYRDNWVRHLLGIARDLDTRVIGRLTRELGYEGLRPSLGPFLSLVWTEPRPVALLAEELSISRQACGQLAGLAERAGYLERIRGRGTDQALRVRLTRRGRKLVADAVRMILEAEASYTERIGADRLRRFTAASASLFFGLGLQSQTDPTLDDVARRSIGVLPLIAVRVEDDLREATRAKGHDVLKLSHARVLAWVGHEGARISEMARIQSVSRQAISATVRDLESLGYVQRDADRADGRGVRVHLTDRGEGLIRDSLEALDELEQSFREVIGAKRFSDLASVAAELHRALRLEEEILGRVHPRTETDRRADDRDLRALARHLERRLGADSAARLGGLLIRGRQDGRG